jgi:hypothetical protein
MKHLLILFTAFSLFATSCNQNKSSKKEDTKSTTKDDYRDKDSDNKDGDRDTDNSSKDEERTTSAGWSAKDINDFVTNCVSTAVDGGMARSAADKYCNCMQQKLEDLYPNSADVVKVDMESDNMKQMVQNCLY